MGLVMKKFVEDDCLLGLWEITEDFFTLFESVKLTEEEIITLNSFGGYKRKLEWLSTRVLLAQMTDSDTRIYYGDNRKPFLTDKSFNISISHSNKLTSILLSKNNRVGLDLEYVSNKITSVASKFLTSAEEDSISSLHRRYHVYIYWCAKEALYKICDKQNINFREDIIIDPFVPLKKGVLKGRVQASHIQEDFILNYFRFQNYAVVWCRADEN